MSSVLYGRLTGRGKQQTTTGTKTAPIIAQAETREAAVRVTLHADGVTLVEFGTKQHDKATPRWVALHTYDLTNVEEMRHQVCQPLQA